MARTHIQQSQISGSLDLDVSDSASLVKSPGSLLGDLNVIRTQLKNILGEASFYTAPTQDLHEIYTAMSASSVDAHFMGAIDTVAAATIGGDITGSMGFKLVGDADLGGKLDVAGIATFDSAITGSAGFELAGDAHLLDNLSVDGSVILGSTSSETVTFTAKAASNLDMNSNKVVGLAQASAPGDALGWDQVASVANLTASNLTAGRVTFAGAEKQLTDSSNMTFSDASGLDLFSSNFTVNSSGDVYALGKLEAAGQVDLAATAVATTIHGTMDVKEAAVMSGTLHVVDNLTAEAKIFNNNALDPEYSLYVVGSTNEISASSKLSFNGSLLKVTGSADISESLTVGAGISVLAGGLTVAGDSMEVTGSFGVDGPATVRSLSVTGSAGISISGDVGTRLYIVDSVDGSIKDESKLTFDGSELWVDGDLEVTGGDITLSNSMSISSATAGKLVLTSDLVEASAGLQVSGNAISGSAGLNIELQSSGDVKIVGDLQVFGDEIKSSTGDVVLQLSGKDAYFKQDVHVAGDLYVTGTMTYIETENLMVKDAFIHIATGSAGSDDKGIVLHSGGGYDDLIMGQNAHDGSFIFGHKDVEAAVDSNNAIELAGIDLADAWMSGVQFGLAEGALSGSLAVDGANMKLSATNDLMLAANSQTAISFIGTGEYAAFNSNFTATTIVGALNELYSAGAGGSKKGTASLTHLNVGTGVLTFGPAGANIGTLSTSGQQFVDVYLNGVLLAPGSDVTAVSTTTVTLDTTLAGSINGDDVITVILRGAA